VSQHTISPILDIDFALLRQQKEALVSIIDMADDELDGAIVEGCEGLLSLLDAIQDHAADVLDPDLVFGVLNEG
jgi:hypothetical protein